ncbi:MAG: PhoX family phosphatase [Actinomycetota bacterium]
MNDTDDIGSNPTTNVHLDDLIRARLNRRQVMTGGIAAAAVGFFGRSLAPAPAAGATTARPAGRGRPGRLVSFTPVPTSTDDTVHVPPGYTWSVLVPWGTPLFAASAPWAKDGSNTASEQEGQVGFNHDGMHYFPLGQGPAGNRHGLLVLNHEYTDDTQIYTAAQASAITGDAAGREKVAKALAAHGVCVVEVRQRDDGQWEHVQGSPFNRRVTGTTPMAFSGPVSASHPMLASELGNPPTGTLNNCAHGHTPWGTYLACEENWNGYFGTDDPGWTRTPLEARYGVTATGFGYNWHRAEPRFDVSQNRSELNHFGWVVEIDPMAPGSVPVKRTALGRFKHEGALVTEHAGRVVVYSGDDENGDYLYKFVGDAPWQAVRARGLSPLDEGTLHVARFGEDGTGVWMALVHGAPGLTASDGFADQADVLIRTRQAADAVGATRLHRPEWVAANSRTGDVFVTLTNGSVNSGAAVNSGRSPNNYGHVVRLREPSHRPHVLTFDWDVFLFAGDPEYTALGGTKVPADQPLFGSPDGIWCDPDGRVWVQTDISNSAQNLASRGYDRIGNNQMLVADPDSGEVKRFLTGPRGCEITGVITTPDQRTMFVNVQHPGESTSFWNAIGGAPTTDNPRSVSNWPDHDPGGRPRSATLVIRRADGGKVGT